MMKRTLLGSLLFVTASFALAETATTPSNISEIDPLTEEAKKGELLHSKECGRCHAHYAREKRKILNYDSLKNQVIHCAETLRIGWWPDDEEMLAVIAYLNEKYYKFEKPADE